MRFLWPFLLLLLPLPALAHPIDEVMAEAAIDLNSRDGKTFDLTIALSRSYLDAYTRLMHDLDLPASQDRETLADTVQHAFAFAPCEVQTRQDGPRSTDEARGALVAVHALVICAKPPTRLEVRRIGYRQSRTRTTLYVTVTIAGKTPLQLLIPPRMESLSVDLDTGKTQAGAAMRGMVRQDTGSGVLPTDAALARGLPQPGQHAPWWQPPPGILVRAWTWEGAWHLLTGWDHLLFLLTLVLAAGRPRSLVLAATAFSVGHLSSMTAALLLHLHAPPWWDVLIGLTIAVSAWRARSGEVRTPRVLGATALGFGLIHGLGFGAGLQALTGGYERLAWPLLSFGMGLDLAQCLWMTLGWLTWRQARRWAGPNLPQWQSATALALVIAGLAAGVWATAQA
jgi:hypothetical protein